MRPFLLLGAALGLLIGACFSDEGSEEECEPGTEGCVCTEDGHCVPPLECHSSLCVAAEDTGTTTTSTADGTSGVASSSSEGPTTSSSMTETEQSSGASSTGATTTPTGGTTTGATSETGTSSTGATSETGTSTTGATTTTLGPCGNGVLEPDEECDPNAPAPYGQDACSFDDCTLLYFDCNPLRDLCPAGWKCRDDGGPPPNLACDQSDDTTDVGQPCTTTRECVRGSICLGGDIDCNNASGCCVPWCDTELVPGTCPNQLSCQSWWQFIMQPPPNPGLDHLGVCRP